MIEALEQFKGAERTKELCLIYLRQKLNGEITLEEFEREIAYIVIQEEHGFLNLRAKNLPPKPEVVKEYEKLKNKLSPSERDRYYAKPEIRGYYEQVERIKNKNRANFLWLLSIREKLFEDDIESRRKVEALLREFSKENMVMWERKRELQLEKKWINEEIFRIHNSD